MYNKARADVLYLRGNYEAAAEMYLEGAREGDVGASFNYGYCLLHGKGVDYDPARAKSFFAYARDMEGGESCYNLAMLYMHGEGVKRDYKQAFRYMRISASQGCLEAQLYLGMVYTTGYMLEPEIKGICMIPFHKPEYADPGVYLLTGDIPDAEADEEARFSVTGADARQAFEWFRRAAHHDPTYVESLVAKGQYLYAKCYIDGLGTDFDRNKGELLMLTAGKSGSEDAVAYLSENGVTPERLLAAAKAVKQDNRGGV
ncbi:MAG: sel1 repeat family protein [Clostridia bacterium]|nr:sel1 repeat family protein [Clostridia bacterium]